MVRFEKKGWGKEIIWADTDLYCGKILEFEAGKKFSMHFHSDKDESWYVVSGKFVLRVIKTKDGSIREFTMESGDTWRNLPLVPHQLICQEAGQIIEVSTKDSATDNYRVIPGDSQI